MLRFAHFNFNVLDLDRSLKFYAGGTAARPPVEQQGGRGRLLQAGVPGRRRDRLRAGAHLAEGPRRALRPGRV